MTTPSVTNSTPARSFTPVSSQSHGTLVKLILLVLLVCAFMQRVGASDPTPNWVCPDPQGTYLKQGCRVIATVPFFKGQVPNCGYTVSCEKQGQNWPVATTKEIPANEVSHTFWENCFGRPLSNPGQEPRCRTFSDFLKLLGDVHPRDVREYEASECARRTQEPLDKLV